MLSEEILFKIEEQSFFLDDTFGTRYDNYIIRVLFSWDRVNPRKVQITHEIFPPLLPIFNSSHAPDVSLIP